MRPALLTLVGIALSFSLSAISQSCPGTLRNASQFGQVPLPDLQQSTVSTALLPGTLGVMEPSSIYAKTTLERWNAPAVARLDVEMSNGCVQTCTGTLLEDNWFLTARHCVVQRGLQATRAVAIFNYTDSFEASSELVRVTADLSTLKSDFTLANGERSHRLDLALVRLNTVDIPLPKPARINRDAPQTNESAYIISHPLGYDRRITRGVCRPSQIGRFNFEHTCDTQPGSSGAPVFDDASQSIIGVHVMGQRDQNTPSNAAVRLDRVASQLEAIAGSAIFAETSPTTVTVNLRTRNTSRLPEHLNVMRLVDLANLEGRVFEAVMGLDELADAGNARAQFALGELYYYGAPGLERNQERGRQLIASAAEANDPEARLQILVWDNIDFIAANGYQAASRAWMDVGTFEHQRNPNLEDSVQRLIDEGALSGFGVLHQLSMGGVDGLNNGQSGYWPAADPAIIPAIEYRRAWAETGSFTGARAFQVAVTYYGRQWAQASGAEDIDAFRAARAREAVGYLERAADRGCITCWKSLADLHNRGSALENGQQRLFYLEKAIDAGMPGLEKMRANLLWEGAPGLTPNPAEAIPVLEANASTERDFERLSASFFKGIGVDEDNGKGLRFALKRFEMPLTLQRERLDYLVARYYEEIGQQERAAIYFELCFADTRWGTDFGQEAGLYDHSDIHSECETKAISYFNGLSAMRQFEFASDVCRERQLYPIFGDGRILSKFMCRKNGLTVPRENGRLATVNDFNFEFVIRDN